MAGGFVFASAITGLNDDGTPAGEDVGAQTRSVLDRLRAVLERAGSSLANAVSVSVYLRQASDFEAMNATYREYFADAPPVRTTVVAGLPPRALVAVSAIAVTPGTRREVLHPAGWMKSPRPYSYIVRAGDLVFLSGLVSRRGQDDQPVPGPVPVQVKTILDNAGVLLRTAGLSYEDVVASRVFLVDEATFSGMNDEYREYFPSAPPARATAIAGLMGASSLVEITLVATAGEREGLGPPVSPGLPLSTGVRAGRFVFLSGVLGNTDDNADDLAGQTREVFARIRRTLDAGQLSFGDVVDNTVYVTDVWKTPTIDQLSAAIFPSHPPARTLVGMGLVARAGLVEMMMTLYK
jgi:enamine deaminase RidA (YjgF/YER057c/UK114 family)